MGASSAAEESLAATEAVQESSAGQIRIPEGAQGAFDSLFETIRTVSESTDTQSTSVEESSSAIEETAASINNVSVAAQHARETARELESVAAACEKSIREASQRVTKIVAIISDLTEQTNLLAMNAAIEAAHAGQEGRGFAVVAGEVKRLAEDEGGQAKQIISQIDEMTDRIERGVKLSDSAGSALAQISNDIRTTVRLIEEISIAMGEQATEAGQIVIEVSSVVNSTHEIRSGTISQSEQSEQIRDFMARVVDASGTISDAASEHVLGNKEVLESIQNVSGEADKNAKTVAALQKKIVRFKLSRDE